MFVSEVVLKFGYGIGRRQQLTAFVMLLCNTLGCASSISVRVCMRIRGQLYKHGHDEFEYEASSGVREKESLWG